MGLLAVWAFSPSLDPRFYGSWMMAPESGLIAIPVEFGRSGLVSFIAEVEIPTSATAAPATKTAGYTLWRVYGDKLVLGESSPSTMTAYIRTVLSYFGIVWVADDPQEYSIVSATSDEIVLEHGKNNVLRLIRHTGDE